MSLACRKLANRKPHILDRVPGLETCIWLQGTGITAICGAVIWLPLQRNSQFRGEVIVLSLTPTPYIQTNHCCKLFPLFFRSSGPPVGRLSRNTFSLSAEIKLLLPIFVTRSFFLSMSRYTVARETLFRLPNSLSVKRFFLSSIILFPSFLSCTLQGNV